MIIKSNDTRDYEARVTFFRSYDFSGVEMRMFLYDRNKRKSYDITGFEVEEKEEGVYSSPTIVLDRDTALMVVESLKNAGFVPADLLDRDGEVEALKGHLDDMRQIVSKNLKVKLEKREKI